MAMDWTTRGEGIPAASLSYRTPGVYVIFSKRGLYWWRACPILLMAFSFGTERCPSFPKALSSKKKLTLEAELMKYGE